MSNPVKQRQVICADCEIEFLSIGRKPQRYCDDCRRYRFFMWPQISGQVAAGFAMLRAKKAGLIKPITVGTKCVDCGNQATVYEHRDYGKPLDVEPVCQSCNVKRGPALQTRFPQCSDPIYNAFLKVWAGPKSAADIDA